MRIVISTFAVAVSVGTLWGIWPAVLAFNICMFLSNLVESLKSEP